MLREYLNRPDIPGIDEVPDGSLWEQLTAVHEALDDSEFFRDTLSGNVSNIGKRAATRIEEFVSTGSIDDDYLAIDEEGVSIESKNSNSGGDYTRGTSLDDF